MSQKITEELFVMTLNSDAKFEEESTCHCKNDMRNLENFHASTRKSQNLHFDGVLMCKEYKVLNKMLQRSYLSSHWTVMQNLKKNLLVVSKMIWGIWRIFMQALKSLEIGTLMGSFCPNYIKVWAKTSTAELYVMTLENDAKFEVELTCRLKNDMRKLVNFDLSTWNKSQNLHFDGVLMSKVYKEWVKKLQRSNMSWDWKVMSNLKKNLRVVAKVA